MEAVLPQGKLANRKFIFVFNDNCNGCSCHDHDAADASGVLSGPPLKFLGRSQGLTGLTAMSYDFCGATETPETQSFSDKRDSLSVLTQEFLGWFVIKRVTVEIHHYNFEARLVNLWQGALRGCLGNQVILGFRGPRDPIRKGLNGLNSRTQLTVARTSRPFSFPLRKQTASGDSRIKQASLGLGAWTWVAVVDVPDSHSMTRKTMVHCSVHHGFGFCLPSCVTIHMHLAKQDLSSGKEITSTIEAGNMVKIC